MMSATSRLSGASVANHGFPPVAGVSASMGGARLGMHIYPSDPDVGVSANAAAGEAMVGARGTVPSSDSEGPPRPSKVPAMLAAICLVGTIGFTTGMMTGRAKPIIPSSEIASMLVYIWMFPVMCCLSICVYFRWVAHQARRRQLTTARGLEDWLGSEVFDPETSSVEFGCVQCSICLEEFVKGAETRLLPCSHRFHMQCIDVWLLGNCSRPTCPLCKVDVRRPRGLTGHSNAATATVPMSPPPETLM